MKRLLMIQREQGMTLLESLLTLIALVALMTLCAQILQHHTRESAAISTALLLKKTGRSVRTYIADHLYEVEEKKRGVSGSDIINAGYFFPQHRNAYQQKHTLQFIQDPSQRQICVITQEGKVIPEVDWNRIAPLLEGYGGYRRSSGDIVGWHKPTLNAQHTASLRPGHLILCYPLHTSEFPSLVSGPEQFLYRQEIPNHPHYQLMKTDLNLQQHAIVFEAPQQQATLSAEGIQFQHTTPEETHHASIALTAQEAKTAYPLLTLEDSKQYRAQISASAVQMSAPSLFTRRHQFSYDTANKKLTVMLSHPHEGLQWHREWHQLPYHHLPYRHLQTKEDLQQAAQSICLLEHDSPSTHPQLSITPDPLYQHLGRMFMVGNIDQSLSTVFICGKLSASPKLTLQAYPIFHTAPPSIEKNREGEKEVFGLSFYDVNSPDQLNKLKHDEKLQLHAFIYDSIEKIIFLIELSSNLATDKPLKDLVKGVKESKDETQKSKNTKLLKSKMAEIFKNKIKDHHLAFNFFLDCYHIKNSTNNLCDKGWLKGLLTQLRSSEKKRGESLTEKQLQKILDLRDIKLFISQCMNFKKVTNNRWIQTVYLLSTDTHLEKYPFCKLNLTVTPLSK